MNAGAVRVAAAVFVLGVLAVWLVKPIGNACPDVSRLPPGSTSSSATSFAPPLTRTCTYSTADGTQARQRYVPIVDWLVLAVVAGLAGAGVGLLGPGSSTPAEREPRTQRKPPATLTLRDRRARGADGDRPERPSSAPPPTSPPTIKPPVGERSPAAERARDAAERERDAAERERARQERARRRERG